MIDIEPHDGAMRTVQLDAKWTVSLYETPHVDRMGKSGIRVTIHDGEVLVYDTGADARGLVYVPTHQSIDSDASLFSACTLCAYDASHGSDDHSREPGWDTDDLERAVAMLEREEEGEDE